MILLVQSPPQESLLRRSAEVVDHPYKWITRISAGVGQATIASMHVTGVMHPARVKSEESGNFGIGTNRPDDGSSVTSTLQRLVKVIELGRDHGSPQLASSGTRGVPAQWRSKAPSRRRFRGRAPGYRRDVANSG